MDGGAAAILNDRGQSLAKRYADPVVVIVTACWFLRKGEVTKHV